MTCLHQVADPFKVGNLFFSILTPPSDRIDSSNDDPAEFAPIGAKSPFSCLN